MGARKQFTPEFKREAVQLLESGNRLWSSSRSAAASLHSTAGTMEESYSGNWDAVPAPGRSAHRKPDKHPVPEPPSQDDVAFLLPFTEGRILLATQRMYWHRLTHPSGLA